MADVTLEFISRQIAQLRDEMRKGFADLEARQGMSAGMFTRLDATNQGIVAELRGMEQMVTTLDNRVRRLEAASTEG